MGNFLKTGKKAQQEMAKEASKSSGGGKRFWLPSSAEARITFLDLKLDEDGLFSNGVYHEHQLHLNGHWRNWFVCIEDDEPCPMCASGDSPSLIAPFRILDHSEWTDNDGNVHKNEIKLFAAKAGTMKILKKLAEKRDGSLVGATFDVSREGDKAPNVGDVFDFVGKHPVKAVLKKCNIAVADVPKLEDMITYKSADELSKIGITGDPETYTGGGSGGSAGGENDDFEDDIPF